VLRVLIVDDHPTMRSAVRAMLGDGVEVDEAADGRTALEAARLRPPDVMLLDLNLPIMDGREVLEALRADPCTAAIRVIVVTASGEECRAAVLRWGAHGYLEKPFDPADLVRAVRGERLGEGSLPVGGNRVVPIRRPAG
jgi:CheY-like chemotaxis protein